MDFMQTFFWLWNDANSVCSLLKIFDAKICLCSKVFHVPETAVEWLNFLESIISNNFWYEIIKLSWNLAKRKYLQVSLLKHSISKMPLFQQTQLIGHRIYCESNEAIAMLLFFSSISIQWMPIKNRDAFWFASLFPL